MIHRAYMEDHKLLGVAIGSRSMSKTFSRAFAALLCVLLCQAVPMLQALQVQLEVAHVEQQSFALFPNVQKEAGVFAP